jgi:tetratricopeptide (TPR) repeat protein
LKRPPWLLVTRVDAELEAWQKPSFWRWLWQRLWPQKPQREALYRRFAERLHDLDDAIVMHPEAASNYVLRGEIYLQLREYALARQDFERACERITEQLEQDRWGLVAQSLQDRAQHGLETALRNLPDEVSISSGDDMLLESDFTDEEESSESGDQWVESDDVDQADNRVNFETDC